MIDAHHHLWDLSAVHYPWLMARGVERFFGDPTPIQRNYLIDEFRSEASVQGIAASVHIQVGAEDGMAEARWVQAVADANPDWPLKQVVFVDLTADDLDARLDAFQELPSVVGVRQIVGRALGEDAETGTNTLLDNPAFVAGLQNAGERELSFDLQLIPELMGKPPSFWPGPLTPLSPFAMRVLHMIGQATGWRVGQANWLHCQICRRCDASCLAWACLIMTGSRRASAPLSKPA